MLSIGRFADATGLTVKALRHYDEIALLEPAHVDHSSGYRYYSPDQVEAAVTIKRLRALELPLDEIRTLLDADAESLRERLLAHGYRVAEEASDKHMLLIELSALVEGGGEKVAIDLLDVPELRLAGAIRHLKLVDPEGVTDMLHTAWSWLDEQGHTPVGPPTALFRSGDGHGTHLVEAGFPVEAAVAGDGVVRVTVYPPARAAVHDHRGSFDELHPVAQRFIATVLGQGLRFGQAIRIEYVELDRHARIVWPLAPS
jgi:DNA-binding transcriptional MerR regulator